MVLRREGGKAFYSPIIRAESFSVPLDSDLYTCFSAPTPLLLGDIGRLALPEMS